MSERSEGGAGRRTPYELVFGEAEFEGAVFPRIRAEAEAQGVDTRVAERFGFLSLAGDVIRSIVPEETPPEALEQYRALFHQSYNFWSYGKRLYVVEPAIARYLVEAAPSTESWEPVAPHPALYLQLPPNLFWGSIATGTPPEPVDGFFVTQADETDAAGVDFRRIEVLAVLGIRRDRAGFSVIPFSTEAGPGIGVEWMSAPGRDAGSDFENVLPGGEIGGLYSIVTTTEALKLVGRLLWYLDAYPADVVPETAAERRALDRPASAPRTRIPYLRLTLGHRGEGGPE